MLGRRTQCFGSRWAASSRPKHRPPHPVAARAEAGAGVELRAEHAEHGEDGEDVAEEEDRAVESHSQNKSLRRRRRCRPRPRRPRR